MLQVMRRLLLILLAGPIACSSNPTNVSDASTDAAADAPTDAPTDASDGGAASGDAGSCPSVRCVTGEYCMVVGPQPAAGPSGTCRPIPSFCTSANVCTCGIIFCSGGVQGCSDNTVYCQ